MTDFGSEFALHHIIIVVPCLSSDTYSVTDLVLLLALVLILTNSTCSVYRNDNIDCECETVMNELAF